MTRALFTTCYPEPDAGRRTELDHCLAHNAAAGVFDRIVLLCENDARPAAHPGADLEVVPVPARPTFADYFACIAQRLSVGDFAVVANSDIGFDGSLRALDRVLTSNCCAALARWELPPDGGEAVLLDRNDSQDTWCFRVPLRPIAADFAPGRPRCDNRLLAELRRAGYEVINPAFSVRTVHHHAGPRGPYAAAGPDHIPPPHAYLWPHNLFSWVRTVRHNRSQPDARIAFRFDRRRFRRSLPGRVLNQIIRQPDSWWGYT
jgi:hypothetical protein